MTPNTEKEMKKAIHQYFREKGIYTDAINRLINTANFDLYYGPTPEGDEPDGDGWRYPGFTGACAQIKDALDDVREIWFDSNCGEVLDREPQGEEVDGEYIEPFWGDYLHLERKDVLRILLGRELVSYI